MVQDILGHADIKTTMHYSKGLAATSLYDALMQAFHGKK
jgi:site-specific recombinase XerD